ncbi:MAG: acyltransferase [Chlorobia bacterium]|nr:acyltransferase [Fimbriimonadaceae bacterium]
MAVTAETEILAEQPTSDRPARVLGIDSLRFVLASIVVLSHLGPIPIIEPPQGSILAGLLGNMFVGIAAVIAFFVISGFCIHLPYANGKTLNMRSYFVRREVRILIPIAAAFAIGFVIHDFRFVGVLWSVVCEEIYYALYPCLLWFRWRFGWLPLMSLAVAGSLSVLMLVPISGDFHAPGFLFTWLLALPIWLLGCILAEQLDGIPSWNKPRIYIWGLRLGMMATASVCSYLRFHRGISYELTLLPFGLLVFYWIRAEISYARKFAPSARLESFGNASYTIYLTHWLAIAILGLLVDETKHGVVQWLLTAFSIAIFAWLFYLLVEGPSHKLARRLGRRLEAVRTSPDS